MPTGGKIMYYDEINQEWIGFGCYISSNNIREIKSLEKVALIKAREELRNESGFYLYSSNNQPERLNEKARKGCDSPNTPTKGSESSRND